MNGKTFSAITAALLILPLGAYAAIPDRDNNTQEFTTMRKVAQHMKHGKRGNRGEKMNRLLQQLDLTSAQSEQIEAIQEQSKTARESLHEQMETQQQKMRSLLDSDATSEQLTQQHQQLQNIRQQFGDNRFETMLQVREILTPEQRARMAELVAQFGSKGDRRR